MLGFEMRRKLRRLLGGPAPLRSGHARELEAELLARFDERHPRKEGHGTMKRLWLKKVAVACAAAMLVGAAACAAPADMEVEVGRSVTIRAAGDAALPDPEAIVGVIRGEGQPRDVQLQARRVDGVTTLELRVWGDDLPEGPAADRIRAAFPALAGAEIREAALAGTVRGTVGAKLGRELFDLETLDREDVEETRRRVMAQLAAQGVEGKVDVQIEDEEGKRKVKVRVEREECPPGEEEDPAPLPP
jgi:hypothetical protein